jgi:hypothetical protein
MDKIKSLGKDLAMTQSRLELAYAQQAYATKGNLGHLQTRIRSLRIMLAQQTTLYRHLMKMD